MACLSRITVFRHTVKVRFCIDFSLCLEKLEAFKGNLESVADLVYYYC